MAEAASFEQENCVLDPPIGVNSNDVTVLNAFRGTDEAKRPVVISCWRLTKDELDEINKTGRIWLGLLGQTMQPAWISGINPFLKDSNNVSS